MLNEVLKTSVTDLINVILKTSVIDLINVMINVNVISFFFKLFCRFFEFCYVFAFRRCFEFK